MAPKTTTTSEYIGSVYKRKTDRRCLTVRIRVGMALTKAPEKVHQTARHSYENLNIAVKLVENNTDMAKTRRGHLFYPILFGVFLYVIICCFVVLKTANPEKNSRLLKNVNFI